MVGQVKYIQSQSNITGGADNINHVSSAMPTRTISLFQIGSKFAYDDFSLKLEQFDTIQDHKHWTSRHATLTRDVTRRRAQHAAEQDLATQTTV